MSTSVEVMKTDGLALQVLHNIRIGELTHPPVLRRRRTDSLDGTAKPAMAKGGLAPWQANRIAGYIEDHLDKTVRVSELAALSKLSVSYFPVAFRRSFGMTIGNYIIGRRIDRAKTMMISTSDQLSRIAVDCGFCDQAHLSRQFRRVTGSTPRRWRHLNKTTAQYDGEARPGRRLAG